MQFFTNAKAEPFDVESVEAGRPLSGHNSVPPYKVEYAYYNGLSTPVTLGTRSGVKFVLPAHSSRFGRQVTVRVFVTITPGVIIDADRLLDDLDDNSPVDLKLIRDALDNGHRQNLFNHQEYVLDYHVSKKELEGRGGSLYLNQLDLAVSLLRPELAPAHPYSEKGYMQALVESNPDVNTIGSFGYALRIVDNSGTFGDRFININKEVFKIPATRDAVLRDGVYLTSSAALEGNYDLCPPRCIRYCFEEADKHITFYRTFEEAKTLGDTFGTQERELKQQQQDFKRQEHEWKVEQAQLTMQRQQQEEDQRKWEHDFKLRERQLRIEEQENAERAAKLKAEREEFEHQRAQQSSQRKEEYEERSFMRKEYTEVLKLIPVVITGIAAIFVAVKRYQTESAK